MGIPKKPEPGIMDKLWEAQSQRKNFVRIRDLPKLKLLKWTAYFFVSSISFFMFLGGPRKLYNQERLLDDARALEKAGYQRPDNKGRIGTSQKFSNNYGFDYAKEKGGPTGDTGE